MHSNSGSIKFTPYSDANDVIDKLFKSLCAIYQEKQETPMKGSDFIFDSVQLQYQKCHQAYFSRGGLYVDSSVWIKKKKRNNKSKKYRR